MRFLQNLMEIEVFVWLADYEVSSEFLHQNINTMQLDYTSCSNSCPIQHWVKRLNKVWFRQNLSLKMELVYIFVDLGVLFLTFHPMYLV